MSRGTETPCNKTASLLICTLISENQVLEKSRYISNPRKISGSANLVFSPSFHPEKKSRFSANEFFLGFEIDLDFSRPWFSEIRVQIKRLSKGREGLNNRRSLDNTVYEQLTNICMIEIEMNSIEVYHRILLQKSIYPHFFLVCTKAL